MRRLEKTIIGLREGGCEYPKMGLKVSRLASERIGSLSISTFLTYCRGASLF